MSVVECYDTLFGVKLSFDECHDEVYLAGTGLVVMVNSRWCFTMDELRFICKCYREGVDVWV